jgi:hypothetical protein
MSPTRISARAGRWRLVRTTFAVKPVSLPTFAFYGHAPVSYHDGVLLVGARSGKPRS